MVKYKKKSVFSEILLRFTQLIFQNKLHTFDLKKLISLKLIFPEKNKMWEFSHCFRSIANFKNVRTITFRKFSYTELSLNLEFYNKTNFMRNIR
ncbi:hypothetical protein LEP1GSC190_14875 [Leptospira mayottensis 200901116]|uniref:Uncharacterized protein n=1 Tax=Leptospira mayottensis 200901122 TaxID=1193010 RepID=A0AA87MR47_9LEPT|nr:hypothetical protein LEP1GSC190_14875 [Leptospira mayottensis 200901116]EKS02185.1 hypothetical protein LEP1GSC125_0798 [Leptospira mayottensis 200901122]